jgi:hypothetical protein
MVAIRWSLYFRRRKRGLRAWVPGCSLRNTVPTGWTRTRASRNVHEHGPVVTQRFLKRARFVVVMTIDVVVLGSAGLGRPGPAPAPPAQEHGTFRSGIELVALNVSVVDAQRRFIDGLRREDFAVAEDGVPRDVTFFGPSAAPIDLGLLLDLSGSMGRNLPLVSEAAIGLIDATGRWTARPSSGSRSASRSFSRSRGTPSAPRWRRWTPAAAPRSTTPCT